MASLQSGGSFFSDLLTGSATSLQTASAMHVKARRKRGPDTDGTVAKQKRLKKAVNSIQPEEVDTASVHDPDWGEEEPANDDDALVEVIERNVDPNPTVDSFEQFQESLFSQLHIGKGMESRKIKPLRLEIPLCRLMPTNWVRQALEADIQTVYDGFHIGNWGTNFWVTSCGDQIAFPVKNFSDLGRWKSLSEEFDSELQSLCVSDPQNKEIYEKIIGNYVNVWDGNHRAIAWMRHIKDHNGDPIKVNCFILNDTEGDRGWISNFMRDINDGTANTTVKKQLAHVLYEVQQIALRDPTEYRPYFTPQEIVRIRDVCKGRWYSMTCDAVTEVYFKRDITLAEREAVKALNDQITEPTSIAIEKAKHDGAERVRKEKMDYMKKIFRLCNPKYHPHLANELDIHTRGPPRKTGAMTIDNLGILVGAQGVDIKRVLVLWNGSSAEKAKYHFPDADFTRAAFQNWLNKRAWWEQMYSRACTVFWSLVGKSKAQKGIGNLEPGDVKTLLCSYFDEVMVYGFNRFFPEIFAGEKTPVRHKAWRDQSTYELGENAVRRFVMRFVRWLCQDRNLIKDESGDLKSFPIFNDWLRLTKEGVFTVAQLDYGPPSHLKALGWYIENLPGVEGYIDQNDANLYVSALSEIKKVKEATLAEKAVVLEETFEYIKEKALVEGTSAEADATELIANSRKESEPEGSQQEDSDQIVRSVVGEVNAMEVASKEENDLVPRSDSGSQLPSTSSRKHNLRPRTERETQASHDDEGLELSNPTAITQKRVAAKSARKISKVDGEGSVQAVKFMAIPIDGAGKSVRLAMNIAMESFVEGIDHSTFLTFLGAIKQINGGRLRQHDKVASSHCVDLIICDTPDNCDVPDVKVGGRIEVPFWNMVKKSTFPAIFHIAEAVLADSGVLLLFVPAEEQAQLMSHPWASDWECLRTFYVVNHRPFSPKWKRLFKAKVLRRRSMCNQGFKFNEIASKVMDWNPESSDVLENFVTDGNLLRCDETVSYRGSKQKSPAFMESMIEICTGKGSAVLDLTGAVGSSVQACEVSGRHILALEEDPATFRTFMKDIAILPSAYVASDVNRVRNLAQHLDELDSHLTQSHAAMSGSSRGIAS